MMKKSLIALLAAGLLLALCACGPSGEPEAETVMATETTVPATVPEDGDPNDVTCKGTYTAEGNASAVAAKAGGETLTNSQLCAWYWAEVAAYRQEEHEVAPDFSKPLDTQVCPIDASVNSWQQYFLKKALNSWHGAQALTLQGAEVGLPVEEAYQPNLERYEKYLQGVVATKYLYRYEKSFSPNTMHQAYLDDLPALLEELAQEKGYADAEALAQEGSGTSADDLQIWAELYNRGYMYYTNLSYYIETTAEEVEAFYAEKEADYAKEGVTKDSGRCVDIRQILLVPDDVVEESKVYYNPEPTEPVVLEVVEVAEDGTVTCSETAWEICQEQAEELLSKWDREWNSSEATFADYARKNSEDPGSTINGGSYRELRQGQLIPELDSWCFDEARVEGDTTIIRTKYGLHILYFSGSTEIWYAEAEEDLTAQKQAELIAAAKEAYPMEVDYSAISLTEADGAVSFDDILYADLAHERFPEVPLYLQADYPTTKYGSYPIVTHGCGITAMAMLASYMADDELTPPELCARYGRYCTEHGTEGTFFVYEPAAMGFYLKERVFDHRYAKEALDEGYIVVVVQRKGYWTRGGHFLVLEDIDENDMVLVRDSNIYNYQKIPGFQQDRHAWSTIVPGGKSYWIFEDKITTIPACARCGEEQSASVLTQDYLCEKCTPALLRRSTYLASCGN